jgi:hypothetical protein
MPAAGWGGNSRWIARRRAKFLVNDLCTNSDGSGAPSRVADRVVEEIRAGGGVAAANHDSVLSAAVLAVDMSGGSIQANGPILPIALFERAPPELAR